MGQFTKRMTRRWIACTGFELTDEVLGRWSALPEHDRSFDLRQLEPSEADGSELMFRRAVLRIGGERVKPAAVEAWWARIGPRGRAGVRLCFYALHQPTDPKNVCTPKGSDVKIRR